MKDVKPTQQHQQPQPAIVNRGFPVEPGQTWHDLTPAQRAQWFADHENRWKKRFGLQNQGIGANMGWTRG